MVPAMDFNSLCCGRGNTIRYMPCASNGGRKVLLMTQADILAAALGALRQVEVKDD